MGSDGCIALKLKGFGVQLRDLMGEQCRGGDGGLVDEHQTVRLKMHPRHAPAPPRVSRDADLLSQPLRRDQGFFYM